tara:strand:+ start:300 stop:812 length:513 start_codon:yes stop_codon:yes gene_type:complete
MSVACDVAECILEKLRLGDGARGIYVIVGESTDTKHPHGFNGHNHSSCKVPTLMVSKRVLEGRSVYMFNRLNVDSENHRARRARGERPVWDDESTCLMDREGAASLLQMEARYKENLDVYPIHFMESVRLENGELGDSLYCKPTVGYVSAKTLDEAKHAIACLDAFTVRL